MQWNIIYQSISLVFKYLFIIDPTIIQLVYMQRKFACKYIYIYVPCSYVYEPLYIQIFIQVRNLTARRLTWSDRGALCQWKGQANAHALFALVLPLPIPAYASCIHCCLYMRWYVRWWTATLGLAWLLGAGCDSLTRALAQIDLSPSLLPISLIILVSVAFPIYIQLNKRV